MFKILDRLKGVVSGCLLCLASACQQHPELPTVTHLDLQRYMGTWKEVASLPQWFQKNCKNTEAIYALRSDGKIDVRNQCWKGGDSHELSTIHGIAWVPNLNQPGRLRVQFFWPISAPYWILKLDAEYMWALVGTPNRKGLWVLSRTGQIDHEIYEELMHWSRLHGFPVENMQRTAHIDLPQPTR